MTDLKLDPDLMLRALGDTQALIEAQPVARRIGQALEASGLPGDAMTFLGLVMNICAIDQLSKCPLGPERLAMLVHRVRGYFDAAIADAAEGRKA